jgi:factor associated with neutral sphingomyelinase activation
MLRQRKAVQRFSLLLLDEGEEYEGDWVATLHPPKEYQKQQQTGKKSGGNNGLGTALGDTLKGRLRLCSMSVAFDPDDLSVPVMKFNLKDAVALDPHGNRNAFTLTTTSFIAMKPNNLDVPYKNVKSVSRGGGSEWVFSLVYAKLESVLPQMHEALYLSQQGRHEQNKMLRDRQIRKLTGKENTFDTAMYLRDAINEKLCVNAPCILYAPLVHSPGRLVITTECLYFQPLYDIEGDRPCKVHPLRDIVLCCKKKFKLQEEIAIEILFWKPKNPSVPRWETSSAFFAFQSREECHKTWKSIVFHRELGLSTPFGQEGARMACKLFTEGHGNTTGANSNTSSSDLLGTLLGRATWCWQRNFVSNFHYLMLLNLVSGRTFNDLSQWPTVPWILKDYTSTTIDIESESSAAFRDLSRPIGALNETRLATLKERFSFMPADDPDNPPFLYGTHYSNPGYVMYWLVRAAPGHLLRLQSGRFDAPDRMFHSMQESWSSVLSNPSDVKELIPEFFVKDLATKFLRANEALPLGSRQNGKSIDAVELPPWAETPLEFVNLHRRALDDSSYVNGHLNEWIDLIFGCKQRGEEAVKADNVFHHMTYASSKDLEKIQDEVHRDAIEQQAQEFGQTPNQIFLRPHPKKTVFERNYQRQSPVSEESDASCIVAVIASIFENCKENLENELKLFVQEKDGAAVVPSERRSVSLLKTFDDEPLEGLTLEDENIRGADLINFDARPPPPQKSDFSIPLASLVDQQQEASSRPTGPEKWDLDKGRLSLKFKVKAHGSAILSLAYSHEDDMIARDRSRLAHRGSIANAAKDGIIHCCTNDGTLKAYNSEGKAIRSSVICSLPLSNVTVDRNNSGSNQLSSYLSSYDGKVYKYIYDSGSTEGVLEAHTDAISAMKQPRLQTDRLVTASWDCAVCVWDLNKVQWNGSRSPSVSCVAEFSDFDASVWSMDCISTGIQVYAGTEEGQLSLWDVRSSDGASEWNLDVCGGQECINSVSCGEATGGANNTFVACACADMCVYVYDTRLTAKPLKKVTCPSNPSKCIFDGTDCIVGLDDGAVHHFNINTFQSPTLGPSSAIHNHPLGVDDISIYMGEHSGHRLLMISHSDGYVYNYTI